MESRAIFIVRQGRGRFDLVILKDSKILDADDFVLFLDVNSVDCMAVIPNKGSAQSSWVPLL